ncbi:hypothetical protein GXB85_14475 [Cellulomonas sp. APG4]|nr:TadE family type IV pilus minor pilin [Cellulomonas sp. APG4]NCT92149.1 hypothetical protein [Cellulomonas sp. APG4]
MVGALPAVVLVLAALLATAQAAVAHLRCADAARAGARAAAAGEAPDEIVAAARRVGGDDAAVAVRPDGAWVVVEVSAPVVGSWFAGALEARGRATAWREP